MTRPLFRLLGGTYTSAATVSLPPDPSAVPPPDPFAVDSDIVVIIVALLCAVICVLGLLAISRCAWLRRFSSGDGGGGGFIVGLSDFTPAPSFAPTPPSNKGLKKKVLRSLPKLTYSPDSVMRFSDCAICLAEFSVGDEVRVLPQCGHGFHVACIDKWLASHSSCPSCRRIPVAATCQECRGGGPPGTSGSIARTETRSKEREDDANSLP